MAEAIAFYVERAQLARAQAIAALNSNRKDRLAVARQHFRQALRELSEARLEKMTR